MGYETLKASIDRVNYNRVNEATFGHLAPMKNTTYRGIITCAVGHYDDLNPTIMDIDLKGLEDSPWLFDAVTELLWDLGNEVLKAGSAYVITTTFRNYRFWTKVKQIKLN